MKKITSVTEPEGEPLEWFDVLEESFGIGKSEMEQLDNEEKTENDFPDQNDAERCFYCNKLLSKDQEVSYILGHKRCVECSCEAITSEEEAKSIVDNCLYVLKYVEETIPWEKSSVKLKSLKFKRIVSIKITGFSIGGTKKKKNSKNKKEKIKKKKKKGKTVTVRKSPPELVRIYVKTNTSRFKLITEIFEWYFGKIRELEEKEVHKRVVKCLFEMGELSYATQYSTYFQENVNPDTRINDSEKEQNSSTVVQTEPAQEIADTKKITKPEKIAEAERKENYNNTNK